MQSEISRAMDTAMIFERLLPMLVIATEEHTLHRAAELAWICTKYLGRSFLEPSAQVAPKLLLPGV
jgi:hypothetical protein